MAIHTLTTHFRAFFSNLNPGPSFESQASREYNSIKGLIEDRRGPAAQLSPTCFLQGSYRQQTAIYTINDVDIVALCSLWQPGSGSGPSYGRDGIFGIMAAPLLADSRYRAKVRYGSQSMCIKVDLGIKVEILPVVYAAGNNDASKEPFRLYRPEKATWEDGYARYHQGYLTMKNADNRTQGNFIPAIKVFKHLRSAFNLSAVSFHIECLLHNLPDALFRGQPADYIPSILEHLAARGAEERYGTVCKTPCGERDIFTSSEWTSARWSVFHHAVGVWARCARQAADASDRGRAIEFWRILLGEDYFPVSAAS